MVAEPIQNQHFDRTNNNKASLMFGERSLSRVWKGKRIQGTRALSIGPQMVTLPLDWDRQCGYCGAEFILYE